MHNPAESDHRFRAVSQERCRTTLFIRGNHEDYLDDGRRRLTADEIPLPSMSRDVRAAAAILRSWQRYWIQSRSRAISGMRAWQQLLRCGVGSRCECCVRNSAEGPDCGAAWDESLFPNIRNQSDSGLEYAFRICRARVSDLIKDRFLR